MKMGQNYEKHLIFYYSLLENINMLQSSPFKSPFHCFQVHMQHFLPSDLHLVWVILQAMDFSVD